MKKRINPNQKPALGFSVLVDITNKGKISHDEMPTVYSVNNQDQGLRLFLDLKGVALDKVPLIDIMQATEAQLREYNRSTKQNAVAGFQISLNDTPAYGIFYFEDGSYKTDNLFDLLITMVGEMRQGEGMGGAMVDRAQRYAHDIKRNIATYNHFYGVLTDEQKNWMLENTISYEHEMAVQKQAAKLKNGGN